VAWIFALGRTAWFSNLVGGWRGPGRVMMGVGVVRPRAGAIREEERRRRRVELRLWLWLGRLMVGG
jgi:hypothetical protein